MAHDRDKVTHGPGAPAVRLVGIRKSFGGVDVLKNVDVDFRQGDIHGIVGENGAGKSTVGKIAGGYYSASDGYLEVFGERPAAWDPVAALSRGVAIMHQELQIVPHLTVAQNVFLGIEHTFGGLLRRNEAARFAAIVQSCGFDLDPDVPAHRLSVADQQKIEIMRAVAREARVVVMDEPTASLTANEIARLHVTMRRLRGMGRTVIYVSHFLEDILETCDRITIMRDGAVVRTTDARDETKATLVSGMLGRSAAEVAYPPRPETADRAAPPLLKVVGLSAPGIRDISLQIFPGEIVGLAGLVGSGRTEIARAIFGADRATGGQVFLAGRPYDARTPERSVLRGIAMVPEDRRKQGLTMTQPVRRNMTLLGLSRFVRLGLLKRAPEVAETRRLIGHFGIHPAQVDGDISTYSGGNQQKALIGKWILNDPEVVILDEPTRGVDLGARRRIHDAVTELARAGKAVLVISSDIDEVLGLSHRAYLVRRGRIAGEVRPDHTDKDRVLRRLFQTEDTSDAERETA